MAIRELTSEQAEGSESSLTMPPSGLPSANPTSSYWLSEPSPILLGHRTTEELPVETDVVVVGSGITGVFATLFLLEKNRLGGTIKGESLEKVVLLEAREVCSGATGRNGGHCQPLVYGSAPAVAAFELEVFKFMESLVKEENIPCDWVSLTGVHAFYSENMFELAAASVDQLQQTHPELAAQMEVVRPSSSSNQGDTLASLRVPTAKGAIVQKKAASLWPYKLVTQIVERLLAKYPPPTFNLQTNTPVTQLTRHESGNRWVAITPRGSITARHVLLATNGYTSHLLPAFADLIVPVRGQVGALLPPRPKVDAGEGSPAKLNHSYVFAADPEIETGATAPRDDYLVQRPMPTGELIYGGGRRFARSLGVGEWRDDELEPQVAEYLRKSLAPVLDLTPSSANSDEKTPTRELNASFEWTGVMGYSRDQHAWVGPVPESMGGGEGLWICAGYTGHGMPAAALSAREVVRQILTTNGAEIEGDAKDGVKLPREFMVSEKRIIEARTLPPLAQGWEATNFATLITSTGLLDQRKAS